MARNGPIDRLRQFLRELSPHARALLIAELERASQHGEDIPGGDLVLEEVRAAARETAVDIPAPDTPASDIPAADIPASDHAAQLFFRPFTPFLQDGQLRSARAVRIPREALEPIWLWLTRDLAPQETPLYAQDLSRALAAGNTAQADRLVTEFQDLAVVRMRDALEGCAADEKARRRLSSQIHTPHALSVLDTVLAVLQERETLDLIAERLPAHVVNFAGPELEAVQALLDLMTRQRPGAVRLALIVTMGRLAAPWQLIRLAIHAAGSNEPSRLAATRYGDAVSLVVNDMEQMVDDVASALRRGGGERVALLLKALHDALRGIGAELDLSVDPPARQIAALRSQIANILTVTIEPLPGRIRQMLRMRPQKEAVPLTPPDAAEVAEIQTLIELVKSCRSFARELAVAELAARIWSELEDSLDVHIRALIASLREDDPHLDYRKAQFQAALRFATPLFGAEHTARLSRSAELASAERKAIPA